MIGIIDYGAGNIKSVVNAFNKVGARSELVSDPCKLNGYDKLVLPGVGAFKKAMAELEKNGMNFAIKDFISSKKPFLGICLGMQLLFDESEEFGVSNGLGVIRGRVVKFDKDKFQTPLKIPHVGWNSITFTNKTPINSGLKDSEYFYFVHSFHVVCDDEFVLGTSEYGYKFVSAVIKDNVFGFQPHPEKSHNIGLKILQNFKEL